MGANSTKNPKLTLPRMAGLLLLAGLIFGAQKLGLIPQNGAGTDGGVFGGEVSEGGGVAVEDPPRSTPIREGDSKSQGRTATVETEAPPETAVDSGAERIAAAAETRQSGFMVRTTGRVIASLPDDSEGDKHQRFILRLSNGHTVLVAHNIDVADRVPCDEGDDVELYGQYEWNEKGGVLHWTHRDRWGNHPEGWIDFEGVRYR